MEEVVTRIVERRFPELTGNYHLPRFAQVIAVADPPAEKGLSDDFRPRYAVDLQVMGPDGEIDDTVPPLLGVPLPVPAGGEEAGFFGFPAEGTIVVMSFAYGLPSKPFILQILSYGLSLPSVPKGDQLWQHSEAVQQRVDAEGNWTRQTDAKITDRATERAVQALDNEETYLATDIDVANHSSETVGGTKTVQALGALKLLSGGSASLASVDDLHLASGRDLNLVLGQKHNAVVGGDMTELVIGARTSVARIKQMLLSPKNHVGSESVNIFQVLCDTLDLIEKMAGEIASHVHGSSPAPTTAADFLIDAQRANGLSKDLKSVT